MKPCKEMKNFLLIVFILIIIVVVSACSADNAGNDAFVDDMILVEAGTTSEDNGSVTADKNFYIGKYHVTQSKFESVMDFNPSYFQGNSDNPVEQVTWYDALIYCNKLSEAAGLDKYYNISDIEYDGNSIIDATVTENENANGYRLPTSDEWEYAARGGKDGDATLYAGSNNLDEVGWYEDNSNVATSERYDGKRTMPVGQKQPNELGLYDMSGNVWDWTNTGRPNIRIFRGGSWNYRAIGVRRIYRNHSYKKSNYRGFRIARTK